MSASNCDYDSTNIPASCQPCRRTAAVRSFDFDAEFRRRYKLQCDDDKDGEDCDCSVSPEHSEYSDDYTSMTGSGASTTTLPPELLADRLETLSVSSGDSYYLYDTDDDDRCSISTLENVDESTTDSPVLAPAGSSVDVEEDSEFNLRARSTKTTAAVCRSTSLKSTYASRAPTSPRTKKVVRFADALGLDLESIRHILDFGDVPPAASDFSGHLAGSKAGGGGGGARMRLMVRFAEPGSSVNFLRRVQERKVSLEEVSVDGERLTVSGVIRVANVAYHKQVCRFSSIEHGQDKRCVDVTLLHVKYSISTNIVA